MRDLILDLSYVLAFGLLMTVIAAVSSIVMNSEPVDYTKRPAFRLYYVDSEGVARRETPAAVTPGFLADIRELPPFGE